MKVLKCLSLIVGLLLLATSINSQVITGFRVQSSSGIPGKGSEVKATQTSLHNAWMGASLSSKLTGEGDLSNNFLFNANILYNIKFGEGSLWNFPVVGNVALPLQNNNFNDVEIGIYPWRILSQSNNGLITVVHGGASYKVTPTTGDELSPQELKVLIGIEVSIPLNVNGLEQALPATLSVAPTYRNFSLEDVEDQFGISSTFIFPIAGNLGILGDLYIPVGSEGRKTEFNAGIIVNGPIGNVRN